MTATVKSIGEVAALALLMLILFFKFINVLLFHRFTSAAILVSKCLQRLVLLQCILFTHIIETNYSHIICNQYRINGI
jgi:hypothetical protein